ncbi:alpha/beta-hydrolase [Leucogyrophana mollusca]|uniref:Alpha/beta-hydrolase n=1 Tax=Leucogyrophana mollusca TaxID=85980 RepID=A0ACB8BDI6_9AGAM|nr:alpha/beta-hydrolase [Leucogyrophana mollusca]
MTEILQFSDIPYTSFAAPNPSQSFDLFIPQNTSSTPADAQHHDAVPPLLCFVHGGAWRSEDKNDHLGLARALARFTRFPVVVPNYRLSPRETTVDSYLHHPEHAKDVLCFLEFLRVWEGPRRSSPLPYDPTKLFLMGHSCGAHILASIFFEMPGDELIPSDWLSQSTKAIIASEGLYDIDLLLSRHPAYRTWFIEPVFGQRDSYGEISPTKAALRSTSHHIHWLIIHSTADEYIDADESEVMYEHLVVQCNDRIAGNVTKNVDQIHQGHDDMLKENEAYVNIVGHYILETTFCFYRINA